MSVSIAPAAAPMPASCPHDAAGGGAAAAAPAALPAGGATAGAAALGGGGAMPDIAAALEQVTQALGALTATLGAMTSGGGAAAAAPAQPVAGGGPVPEGGDAVTGLQTRLDAAVAAHPDKQAQLEELRPMIDQVRVGMEKNGMASPADGANIRSKILRITASPEHTAKLDQIDGDIEKLQGGAAETGAFNPGAGLSLELRLRAVEQDLQGYDPAAFDTALQGADALAAKGGDVDPAQMEQLLQQRDAAFGGTTTPDALI